MRARFKASGSRPEMVSMSQRYAGAAPQSGRFRIWLRGPCGARRSRAGVRFLLSGDIQFSHLLHGRHGALRPGRILVTQQLGKSRRHHLPRQAVAVLEPAAAPFSACGGKFLPQTVDLCLAVAADDERDRFRELEMRTAVEGGDLLAIQLERNRHDGALRTGTGRTIAHDFQNPRVAEEGHVEIRGLLGLGVEPQERTDLLHGMLLRYLATLKTGSQPASRAIARAKAGRLTTRRVYSSMTVDFGSSGLFANSAKEVAYRMSTPENLSPSR